MNNVFWNWGFDQPEILLGILTCKDVEVTETTEWGEHVYTYDLISFGFIIFRIDIIFNKEEQDG